MPLLAYLCLFLVLLCLCLASSRFFSKSSTFGPRFLDGAKILNHDKQKLV
jgi:hypothetical protein